MSSLGRRMLSLWWKLTPKCWGMGGGWCAEDRKFVFLLKFTSIQKAKTFEFLLGSFKSFQYFRNFSNRSKLNGFSLLQRQFQFQRESFSHFAFKYIFNLKSNKIVLEASMKGIKNPSNTALTHSHYDSCGWKLIANPSPFFDSSFRKLSHFSKRHPALNLISSWP